MDHFYSYYFNTYYEYTNLALCRIMLFIQYTSLQISAWLLCLLTIDRFVTVMGKPGSIYKKLPFSTPKTAFYWSIGIITIFVILNCHEPFLNGFYSPSQLVNETISEKINGSLINKTISILVDSNNINCGIYIITGNIMLIYLF